MRTRRSVVLASGLALLLLLAACTGADEVVAPPQSEAEVTELRLIEEHPTLGSQGCASSERWRDGNDLLVFFEPSADASRIDALRADLTAIASVERSTYVGTAASAAEFEAIASELPPDWPQVLPEEIPTRIELELVAPVDENVAVLIDQYQGDPAIFEMVTRPALCPLTIDDAVRTCELLEIPRDGAVMFEPSASADDFSRVGQQLESSGLFDSRVFRDADEVFADTWEGSEVDPLTLDRIRQETGASWDVMILADADPTLFFEELEQDPAVVISSAGRVCHLP